MKIFESEKICALILLFISAKVAGYKYKSAPGCTKESENGLWLLGDDNKCYKVNTRGPCGENMLFFVHPNNRIDKIGFCDCFDARIFTEEEIEFTNNRELNGCLKAVRSQIFVPEKSRCYPAFHQGPCETIDKWLVLNETNYPVCAKNQCLKDANPRDLDPTSVRFSFSHSATDKCYISGLRCRYSVPAKTKIQCPVINHNQVVLRSRCKPGSRRSLVSNCLQSVNPRR